MSFLFPKKMVCSYQIKETQSLSQTILGKFHPFPFVIHLLIKHLLMVCQQCQTLCKKLGIPPPSKSLESGVEARPGNRRLY